MTTDDGEINFGVIDIFAESIAKCFASLNLNTNQSSLLIAQLMLSCLHFNVYERRLTRENCFNALRRLHLSRSYENRGSCAN